MPFPPPNLPLTAHPPPLPITRPPIDCINNPPPLFPAAINNLNTASINLSSSINNELSSTVLKSTPESVNKQSTVTNGTANSNDNTPILIVQPANGKIIHPEEDISLEEHRIRLPKYKLKTNSASVQNLLQNFVNHNSANAPVNQSAVLLGNTITNNVINNYSRSYDNVNNDSNQPCYQTPINDHARNYYRKT